MADGGTVWTELAEDADVSGGVRSEDGGLPAQPAVIKEYGRFAYLEGNFQGKRCYGARQDTVVKSLSDLINR